MAKPEITIQVWAVVYSNYEPAEVDSLWATQELAEKRAAKLEGMWDVTEWTVGQSDPDEVKSE